MPDHDPTIAALIQLHDGLDRLGPGDDEFSREMLQQLPALPSAPRIADLGCGTGAGALLLAQIFHTRIRAVDFSREFLNHLTERAKLRGLDSYIETIEGDIGQLDWPPGSIDLLWSEGAAYNLTFTGALCCWRPLLDAGGVAVISEMNYFSDQPSAAVTRFMQQVYPTIKDEPGNIAQLEAAGFELLGLHRLPSKAWWKNYYDPLRGRIDALGPTAGPAMLSVIDEIESEMRLFEAHADEYGYSCYLLRAV